MNEQDSFSDYMAFRKMITPVVIQIIFWIGIIACVLVGIGFIASYHGYGEEQLFAGIALIVICPFVVRFYCEIAIYFLE